MAIKERSKSKAGRKPSGGPGTMIMVRLHDPMLAMLDRWAAAQMDHPSRPESIRRMMMQVFDRDLGYRPAPPPPEPLRESWPSPYGGVRHSIVEPPPRPKPTREEVMAWLQEEMAREAEPVPKPAAKPKPAKRLKRREK